MKIKSDLELRSICGELLIIPSGSGDVDFNKMYVLNETSAFLWRAFQGKDFTAEAMVDALLEEYDVTVEQASTDVDALLKQWQDCRFLTD